MFKPRPRSSKRKGQKGTSKSGTSAQQTISSDEEPENFGFLYQIDALETIYDERHQPRILKVGGSKGNDIARLWFPPTRTSQFKRRAGNIYRWPGEEESEKLEGDQRPENLRKFQVASVFFQAKQDNFLAVFKDCVKHDIAGEDFGWSQIGFHHRPGFMSDVDIGGEKDLLAAPADDSPWMPQVVPEVYNYDTKSPSAGFTGRPGGLCGRLSLLIAMAAFSAPVSHAENIVSKCFGYKTWEPHTFRTGIGRKFKPASSESSHFLDVVITRVWLIYCRVSRTRSGGDNISRSGSDRRNIFSSQSFRRGQIRSDFCP
jgi:hypothetical protein